MNGVQDHLRRAGIELLLNAITDLIFRAPGHEGVDQAVAAAILEIAFVIPAAKPVAVVIGCYEIKLQGASRGRPRRRGIARQADVLRCANPLVRPDDSARPMRTFGWRIEGMSAVTARSGELLPDERAWRVRQGVTASGVRGAPAETGCRSSG